MHVLLVLSLTSGTQNLALVIGVPRPYVADLPSLRFADDDAARFMRSSEVSAHKPGP